MEPHHLPLDEEENAPWRSWANAEAYDQFVRQRSIYGWLNETLVELAGVGGDQRILDIGCGTGATSAACLPRLGFDADIVAIDASDEMVEVARANVVDSRVRFEVRAASEIDRLEGPFDRFLSNAAFWQFPSTVGVLRRAAALAAPGARFVFNIPAERVAGESTSIHPIQARLLRAIEARRPESRRPTAHPTGLDLDVMAADAREAGFHDLTRTRRTHRCRQEDLLELMSIPAMILPLTPGFDADERSALLREVRDGLDLDLMVEVPWVFVTLTRRDR